jgi:hypothetical protein
MTSARKTLKGREGTTGPLVRLKIRLLFLMQVLLEQLLRQGVEASNHIAML